MLAGLAEEAVVGSGVGRGVLEFGVAGWADEGVLAEGFHPAPGHGRSRWRGGFVVGGTEGVDNSVKGEYRLELPSGTLSGEFVGLLAWAEWLGGRF